eukprot:563248-Pyramimonas_sp.AAC.1
MVANAPVDHGASVDVAHQRFLGHCIHHHAVLLMHGAHLERTLQHVEILRDDHVHVLEHADVGFRCVWDV